MGVVHHRPALLYSEFGADYKCPVSTRLEVMQYWTWNVTVDIHVVICVHCARWVYDIDRPARRGDRRRCSQQARPSTSFVDNTIDLSWRNFLSAEFETKFQIEMLLCSKIGLGGRKHPYQLDLPSRFDAVPACDRKTDGETHDIICRTIITSCGKNAELSLLRMKLQGRQTSTRCTTNESLKTDSII